MSKVNEICRNVSEYGSAAGGWVVEERKPYPAREVVQTSGRVNHNGTIYFINNKNTYI